MKILMNLGLLRWQISIKLTKIQLKPLGKDNQEINKIEATMDAEANKKIPDNTLSDKNIIDDNKILNETNSNNDDEVG